MHNGYSDLLVLGFYFIYVNLVVKLHLMNHFSSFVDFYLFVSTTYYIIQKKKKHMNHRYFSDKCQ